MKNPGRSRGFLLSKLFKLGLDGHPECELESLQDQSDSDDLAPLLIDAGLKFLCLLKYLL